MDLLHPQLAAFAAVIEDGSFDAAARRLCITSSAVSQRIRALEDRLGQVLVLRQAPCLPTPAGERLLRRVRPMQALEAEAVADFLPEEATAQASRPIPIAVNDDSLHTWIVEALATLHDAHGYFFDVRVDDQDHTLDLLRAGTVLGAVTSAGAALQGCRVLALGVMRYHAIASPAFVARHFPQGMDAASLGHAPMVVFNRKDELQWRLMRRITRARLNPPMHYLPSALGFVDAAARGLGWCLAPESLLEGPLKADTIRVIDPKRWLDVPLYWQQPAVRSATLDAIAGVMRDAAAGTLRT